MKALEKDPESAEIFYYLGLTIGQNGDLPRAVGAFKRAIDLSPIMTEAHKGVGIAYYQLQLVDMAIKHLTIATNQQPLDATTNYFLGMAHTSKGEYKLARQHIKNAVRLSNNEKILKDANSLLKYLEMEQRSNRRWRLTADAGLEYDDNVTLSEVDRTSGLDDTALVFELSSALQLYEKDSSEVEIGYDFYNSSYDELKEFNLQSHNLFTITSHSYKNITGTFRYNYNYISLGDEAFLKTHTFSPSLSITLGDHLYHSINYSYKDEDFVANDRRDGTTHTIGLNNYYFLNTKKSYAFLNLRAEDETTKGQEFTYFGYYVTAGIKYALPFFQRNPELQLSYQYYLRDYKNITPSLADEREDSRSTVSLRIRKDLNSIMNISASYQYVNANSNLNSLNFNENVVGINMGLEF